jgi:AraC-like DNA-binding protein
MKSSITIEWSHAAPLAQMLANTGATLDEVLRATPLAGTVGGPVSLSDYFRIRAAVVAFLRDETCNMSARQLVPGSTQFVLQRIPPRTSLGEVLRILAEAYNVLHGGTYNAVTETDDEVRFQIDDAEFPFTIGQSSPYRHFVMESTLIYLTALIALIGPPRILGCLNGVCVRRPDTDDAPPHLSFWTVPVTCGARLYELAFDRTAAGAPFGLRDDLPRTTDALDLRLADTIDSLLSGGEQSGELVREVRALIAAGATEQDAVAERLCVSTATLRRNLSREGQSFRSLRRDVLYDQAQRLLLSERSIADIADLLGFSDVRSFNRAFRQWSGETPNTYRRQEAQAPRNAAE